MTAMRYMTGDIWTLADELEAWVVVPTNTCIRQVGRTAVMGKGMALEAAQRHKGIRERLGEHIAKYKERIFARFPLICLPTKRHWRHPSKIEYIEQGCHELVEFAELLDSMGNDSPILIPKLGCGLGGLNWERQVRPVVDSILLSDRFIMVSQ